MSLLTDLKDAFNDSYDKTLPLGSTTFNYNQIRDQLIDEIIAAFKAFIITTEYQTTYSGSASAGSSAGTVQSINTTHTLVETPFKAQMQDLFISMDNNNDWADGVTDIFVGMCEATIVKQDLTGTLVPNVTPPPTIPAAGTATGQIQINSTLIQNPLRLATNAVNGNNDSYAIAITNILKSAMSASTVNMNADPPLSGLTGVGVNTLNN